jgi:twitching motility two-component system response regulator PilH
MPIKRILVVDDSPTERHNLNEILTKAGYQISFAHNGEEGVAKVRSDKPDLVVMDVVMPGLNGFQACRTMTQDPETQHIPVILCTTKNQETDKIWAMRQGAKAYVTKPVDGADLLKKITALG